MANTQLQKFIESRREKGDSDKKISELLVSKGWSKKEIDMGFAVRSDDEIEVPIPPQTHFGMWVAFLYVILFISLYVCATAFAGILHFAVDEKISDSLDKVNYGNYFGQYLMQGYLACLIVGFPIFAGLFLFLKNQMRKTPLVKNLKSRKILVYLTLIGTFILLVGHLITTVYGFLGGSVTTRSIAHLGITFFVAGSIFVYFLIDVWNDRKQS